MFQWLKKDPGAKLEKQYQEKLEEAMMAQRNGNIRLYSELTQQAEEIRFQIQKLNDNL